MRKSAIRCTICGKPAPPGAVLCPPCRAALKRAGHLTVQDLPHYLAPVRRPGGNGHRASDEQRPGSVARAPTTRRIAGRRLFAGVAALAVLAGVAYLGQAHPEPDRAVPTAGRPAGPEPSAAAAAPAVAGTPSGSASASAAAVFAPPAPPVVGPVQRVTARMPARTTQAALRAEAIVTESAVPVPEGAAPAPELLPASPALREAPPPPDRWQQMSDALARCDREGGFSGFVCDQRERLNSCEGYWGKVPQCPNPPENPR